MQFLKVVLILMTGLLILVNIGCDEGDDNSVSPGNGTYFTLSMMKYYEDEEGCEGIK